MKYFHILILIFWLKKKNIENYWKLKYEKIFKFIIMKKKEFYFFLYS